MIEFISEWWKEVVGLIVALLAVGFRDHIIRFFKLMFTTKLEDEFDNVQNNLQQLSSELDNIKNTSDAKDIELLEKLQEISDILIPLRDATLSSHMNALTEKCKKYCCDGEIDANELDMLGVDYQTYKSLGGNGHMEAWMEKVRRLKVK